MTRIINTQSPGKERRHLRRTIAEALRRLSEKPELDGEARDLTALIVFSLRGIEDTVKQVVEVWEKRNYYLKADRFRSEWSWAGRMADRIEKILRGEEWEELPQLLAQLLPHFEDIRVARMTRSPSLWRGAYARLLDDAQDGRAHQRVERG
ncbi:MAG: hypothetical protein U9Q78_04695 [Chloroflexota bacterium]|nr:hypothetical protein [Chloroflexota bacterium]